MIAEEYDGGWETHWCPRRPEGWGWWMVTLMDEGIVAEAHHEWAWYYHAKDRL